MNRRSAAFARRIGARVACRGRARTDRTLWLATWLMVGTMLMGAVPSSALAHPLAAIQIERASVSLGACCASTLAWSPDGTRLTVGSGTTLRLLHGSGTVSATSAYAGTVRSIATFSYARAVRSIAWSLDGKMLAVGFDDGTAGMYRADGTLLHTLTGHTKAVNSMSWSPKSWLLATASDDGWVRLWQLDGHLLTTLTMDYSPLTSVAWSPRALGLLAYGGTRSVMLESPSGMGMIMLPQPGGTTCLAWAPNGKMLAAASPGNIVWLWTSSGQLVRALVGHTGAVTSVAWSSDGTMLATGSADHTVRVWRADGTPVATLTGSSGAVRSVAWAPNHPTLASVAGEGVVRLWTIGS